jgi:proteasome lid subunit RPN8/RPN11
MELQLPEPIVEELVGVLAGAGSYEVGGILMGEHLAEGVFRVAEITVQRARGTFASFVRLVWEAVASLERFFRRTGRAYTRFNYLGEWHSHPAFSLEPSDRDCRSMQEIVDDPSVGANFAVLLIVRLDTGRLNGRTYVFLPGGRRYIGHLVIEGQTDE